MGGTAGNPLCAGQALLGAVGARLPAWMWQPHRRTVPPGREVETASVHCVIQQQLDLEEMVRAKLSGRAVISRSQPPAGAQPSCITSSMCPLGSQQRRPIRAEHRTTARRSVSVGDERQRKGALREFGLG